jgi:hypothetical protein
MKTKVRTFDLRPRYTPVWVFSITPVISLLLDPDELTFSLGWGFWFIEIYHNKNEA